jgi:hypothetical protein
MHVGGIVTACFFLTKIKPFKLALSKYSLLYIVLEYVHIYFGSIELFMLPTLFDYIILFAMLSIKCNSYTCFSETLTFVTKNSLLLCPL